MTEIITYCFTKHYVLKFNLKKIILSITILFLRAKTNIIGVWVKIGIKIMNNAIYIKGVDVALEGILTLEDLYGNLNNINFN